MNPKSLGISGFDDFPILGEQTKHFRNINKIIKIIKYMNKYMNV